MYDDDDDVFDELEEQDVSSTNLEDAEENIYDSNDEINQAENVEYESENNENVDYNEEKTEEELVEYVTEDNVINGWAISSLVFGVASLIFWLLPYIGFATSIIGIMLAAISRKNSSTSISKIAIVMCIVGIFITLTFSIFKVLIYII